MAIWTFYNGKNDKDEEILEIRAFVDDDTYDPDSGYYTHIYVDINIGYLCRFVADSITKPTFDLDKFIFSIEEITDLDNDGQPSMVYNIKNCETNYEMAREIYKTELYPLINGIADKFSEEFGLTMVRTMVDFE